MKKPWRKEGEAVFSENLETSDAEQSRMSRSKWKTKIVFDPSCVIKKKQRTLKEFIHGSSPAVMKIPRVHQLRQHWILNWF